MPLDAGANTRAAEAASPAAAEAWRRMRDLTHHPDVLGRARTLTEEVGLTPTVTRALVYLGAHQPTPMRELAGALHCDNSYVTAIVDSLEARAMARRLAHPTDRRVKVVALTDRGAALAARIQGALDEPPAAFSRLSEGEAERLLDLVRRLSS